MSQENGHSTGGKSRFEELQERIEMLINQNDTRKLISLQHKVRNPKIFRWLTPNERQAVKNWLNEIVDAFPNRRKIDFTKLKKRIAKGNLTARELSVLLYALKKPDLYKRLTSDQREEIIRLVISAREAMPTPRGNNIAAGFVNSIDRALSATRMLQLFQLIKKSTGMTREAKTSVLRRAREKFQKYAQQERMTAIKQQQMIVRQRRARRLKQ